MTVQKSLSNPARKKESSCHLASKIPREANFHAVFEKRPVPGFRKFMYMRENLERPALATLAEAKRGLIQKMAECKRNPKKSPSLLDPGRASWTNMTRMGDQPKSFRILHEQEIVWIFMKSKQSG